MTVTAPEIDHSARTLPSDVIKDLFARTDNTAAFNRTMGQGGTAYLPELTAAYYIRQSYDNGSPPPETLPQDHPLRQRLEALNLDEVTDPAQREVFGGLRHAWQRQAEGLPNDDENIIATLLVPGLIRSHPAKVGAAIVYKSTSRLQFNTSDQAKELYRGIVIAAHQKLTSAEAQAEYTAPRLELTFAAMGAVERANLEYGSGFEDLARPLVEQAGEVIAKETGAPAPIIATIKGLLDNPVPELRREVQGEFADDATRADKVVAALAEHPRMQKLLQSPSLALADFLNVIYSAEQCDPQLLAEAASGLITEYYAQASRAPGPAQREHYTTRVRELTEDVAAVEASPETLRLYKEFLAGHPIRSAKTETRALRIYKTLARFGTAIAGDAEGLDAIENKLVDGLFVRLTGASETPAAEQRTRLLERFGAVDPLLAYSLKFMDQDAYRTELAGLMSSVMNDTYETWHRGDGSAEALQAMIQAGYLPSNMTAQQYTEWCTDDTSTSLEQLLASAADTAAAVRNSVANGSVDIALIAPGYSVDLEGLKAVVSDRNALGRFMGEINKASHGQTEGALGADAVQAIANSMGELSQLPGIQDLLGKLAEHQDVGQIKNQVEGTRAQLEQLRLLIRVANITPEEIVAGELLSEASHHGTRRPQQQLAEVLAFLRRELPPELRFIPDSVAQLLASASSEQGEAAIMTAQDTIDPKVTLEIGQTPQRTCQHYETGGYNQGLIGYFGPDVKVSVIRNEKGNIIARSILRVMEDDEGNTVLFAEPVYQAVVSPQIKTLLAEHVSKKSAKMGVELRGSLADAVMAPATLKVRALKMPAVYSDNTQSLINTASLTIKA